jgi:hypothetical protein
MDLTMNKNVRLMLIYDKQSVEMGCLSLVLFKSF